MQYKKIINLLVNMPNQISKFTRENWVEINDVLHGMYNINRQIDLKLQC